MRWASVQSSSAALAMITPPPATISGFLEVTRTSIARRSWFRLARNVGQYDRITTSSGQTNSQLAC